MYLLDSIASILILILPALPVAWALAVWLPHQPFSRWSKIKWTTLISLIALLVPAVGLLAIQTTIISGRHSSEDVIYFGFPLLFTLPLMAGSAALLYFGGKAVRLHLSRTRVVFGYVRVILGFLLWLLTVLWYSSLVEMLWYI